MSDEDTSGFYKADDGVLVYGPNFVINVNYELRRETKDSNTYPVDGWSWFESRDDALSAFGIVEEPPAPEAPSPFPFSLPIR